MGHYSITTSFLHTATSISREMVSSVGLWFFATFGCFSLSAMFFAHSQPGQAFEYFSTCNLVGHPCSSLQNITEILFDSEEQFKDLPKKIYQMQCEYQFKQLTTHLAIQTDSNS